MTLETDDVCKFADNFKALDDLAGIYGLARKKGETDESLQGRLEAARTDLWCGGGDYDLRD